MKEKKKKYLHSRADCSLWRLHARHRMVLDEIERARRTGRRDYDRSMGRRQHLGAQRRAHETTEHGKEKQISTHGKEKEKKKKKKSRVVFDRPQ
jgi:hypothetical protein